MNKPIRYFVITQNNPKGYTYNSIYNQHENIIKRAEKRGDKVKSITTYSISTGKGLGTHNY